MYLKQGFKNYLVENNVNEKSVSSYISYVRGANRELNGKLFNYVQHLVIITELERFDELLDRGIEKIESSTSGSKEKYISGFKKYIDFIKEVIQNINPETEITDINELLSSQTEEYREKFPFEEVREIFFQRLISQNRQEKNGICFPISFIKQYFYKTEDRSYFDEIINTQIKNIKFITDGDKTEKLGTSNIYRGVDGQVFVGNKKVKTNNYKEQKKEYLKVDEFSEITIDHTLPMHNILKYLSEKDYPQMYFISKKFVGMGQREMKRGGTKLSNNINFINSINKDSFKKEFESIVDKMDLVLMLKKYNIQKGKN